MESTGSDGHLPPNFLLTPQQQSLLLAALNANKAFDPAANGISLSPNSFSGSPQQTTDLGGFQESPYLDTYDVDFGGDSSFDYSIPGADDGHQMNEDLPVTEKSDSVENESHEKRSHPDDDDEGSPSSPNAKEAKRRESTEKVPKKPGRKPLTSEPTSKRKAQNRAAQRAFRERKEKHLKDLETKVQELEKSSEAKGTENAALRAKIESMTAQLNEYKNKLQLLTNSRSWSGSKTSHGFGQAAVSNLSDVNFHFEFPKFGMLPGPPLATKQPPQQAQAATMFASPVSANSNPVSPSQQTLDAGKSLGGGAGSFDSLSKNDLAQLSSVFGSPAGSNSLLNGSRTSVDSPRYSLGGAATSSPSASSNSNVGASSSCGTSPEPFTQSPLGSKPVDTMTTIGEEHSTPQSLFEGIDVNAGFDWLAQQNGGQFDPQLFGDYREPQESILANTALDDGFFNEALEADFFTPYNMPASPAVQKKSLVAEIEARQGVDGDGLPVTSSDNLNCAKIWEKLQNCPKVQNGEFDLDSLCTELQKKAKCSGKGPLVQEQEFKSILKKYLGKELAEGCKDSFSS